VLFRDSDEIVEHALNSLSRKGLCDPLGLRAPPCADAKHGEAGLVWQAMSHPVL